jgi:MtrB/PioB family decaheme-associated outer membrane protein
MNTREQHFGFKQNLLVLAMLAAFGSAHAADDEIAKLIKPDATTVSVGAAVRATDRQNASLFGQYNGWSKDDGALLLDFELIQRDDETGTWMNAEGRNLGLDNRELSFSRQRQGTWKYAFGYSEQVRHDPRTLNTGLQGIGSSQLTVNGLAAVGAGTKQNLDVKRRSYTLAGEDWINPNLMLEFSLKSEDKEGARLSNVGGYCGPSVASAVCPTLSGAMLMLAEPVTSNTQQVEAKANFLGSGFSLTAGYYGTLYTNDKGSMRVAGINGNLVGNPGPIGNAPNTLGGLLSQPIALAPDNQSYQLYLAGTYTLTPAVHATFNYATTHATQNESFAGMGLTAAAGLPSSLNGAVDTTLTQAGITARPVPKLSLLANVRYEQIEDKTPHARYGGTYTNQTNPSSKANSKAEATYVFPANLRGTFGVDYNWVKRGVPSVGSTELFIPTTSLTSIRETTNELVYRAEVRKPLTDALNATLAYSQATRDGSHWINLGNVTAQYPQTYQVIRNGDMYSATGVFPTTMMDRKRDKVRAQADWSATDALSVQFSAENGYDTYSAPTLTGLKSGSLYALGVDVSYLVSDSWKATGFVNYGEQLLNISHSAGYIARINNITTNFGAGVVGKLSGKLEVGGDLNYMDDNNAYGLGSGNTSAAGVLPDVSYRVLALKLFGKYALDNQSDIQLDLLQQNTLFSEWTWGSGSVPYAYSDNSTVSMQSNQKVTYLGAKYVYRLK